MKSTINGIAASDGIAIAKAFRLEHPVLEAKIRNITDIEAEQARLDAALDASRRDLEEIRKRTAGEIGEEEAAIFSAHLLVLDDPELIGPVKEKIKGDGVNAEYALDETASGFITLFESMDNDYMKERAADIRDVTKRILSHLLGVTVPNPALIREEVIVVAEDLTPSDTVQLNPAWVKGFVTDIGGRTSHSAILARTLEIPAVVGIRSAMAEIADGDIVIVDGTTGEVIVRPDEQTLAGYTEKQQAFDLQRGELSRLAGEPSVSADGHRIEIAGNIGSPADAAKVLENGGEGVGLFRTEFLYMGRDSFPTEDEQYEAYRSVLEQMDGRPTIVRTLDIGGDKKLSYMQLPEEENPFLGIRAIRLCLEEEDMFRIQLRALLRASVHGKLKIMFPMIATVDEFRRAKAVLLDEKQKLTAAGTPVGDDFEVGMMVEIPAAALMADAFAKEVDFFSIGTNDLIQYTMAADRMNERLSYLYQPFSPAVLRLIRNVIDAAHRQGKMAGMCGEMAGDERAIPLLLGMGLDEFSMSASSILKARAKAAETSKADMENRIDEILSLASGEEVLEYLENIR
ncbi:phosphoenolpyruvate--protein phosphotransferase [Edaphobacillus lindanitolerans]|uniref:Phosphoenolpyruvate-protein phosphotransferase n=1 Tax=Edaphobacillus lindanitolerans TaxID=550447 RepID=A0A1U7PRZ7_9BACI|nr:phosphoenolpyruvate--protein phosphotransferase [Edaphobacillus lindanitolerans]SIT87903.1 phosphoenolpyruvate--protein phosphotransferase [Edaphobacillus lindanitolerans]